LAQGKKTLSMPQLSDGILNLPKASLFYHGFIVAATWVTIVRIGIGFTGHACGFNWNRSNILK
jgi:hypothetical protein